MSVLWSRTALFISLGTLLSIIPTSLAIAGQTKDDPQIPSPDFVALNSAQVASRNEFNPDGGLYEFSPSVYPGCVRAPLDSSQPEFKGAISLSAGGQSGNTARHFQGGLTVLRISIIAGISKVTADHYRGFETAKALILNQIASVNSRFNDPGVFNNVYYFAVDSVYEFAGNPLNEILLSHPAFDYRITYDGYPTQGGGWYGPPWNAIHHSWPVSDWGGTFAAYATDGIVHESGHARGAIDLYGMQVDAVNNPVSGQSYHAETSIMNYPYDIRVWDQHTINIINRTADTIISSSTYIDESFPANIGISIRDSTGLAPLSGALVKLYPVNWYSYEVSASSTHSGLTSTEGNLVLPTNPFVPFITGSPWDILYPNFLILSELNGTTKYAWLPITEVQNAYFLNKDTNYRLILRMPLAPISIEETWPPQVPSEFSLSQNYPNPFNPVTNISFAFASKSYVTLEIFNIAGQKVATLVDEDIRAG